MPGEVSDEAKIRPCECRCHHALMDSTEHSQRRIWPYAVVPIGSALSSVGQFALVPIPLFLLMGELLLKTGLAARTVEVVDQWIGRIPGRLSLSSVGGGTLFGALSGASMASVAMLGSTLVPEMARRGYKPAMSVSSILAGGGLRCSFLDALGVLLGAMAKVSIAELLLGGILPGLVLAVMYIAYFAVRATVQPELAPRYAAPPVPSGRGCADSSKSPRCSCWCSWSPDSSFWGSPLRRSPPPWGSSPRWCSPRAIAG